MNDIMKSNQWLDTGNLLASNRLAVLAQEIRAAHEDVRQSSQYSAARAVDAGRWLAEAKADEAIPRGGWERWVEQVAGVPHQTADRYINLFRAVSEQRLTIGDIADAGQIGVLKMLTQMDRTQRRKALENAAIAEALKSIPIAERCTLAVRDVADLVRDRPGSVDWIITDPPYPREYLPVYAHLARGAAHVLRDGGVLLCMIGQSYLPDVVTMLAAHLQYHWTIAFIMPGGHVQIFPRHTFASWKPILMFTKGDYAGEWFNDLCQVEVGEMDKEHHGWGQPVSGMADIMQRMHVAPGNVVLDPFLGGGATAVAALAAGAHFIGYDIDQSAVDITSQRVMPRYA